MKKVLLISYYYPPLADVGNLRATGFAKHLPVYGWHPIVLTVKNPDKHYCQLGEQIPAGTEVHRSLSLANLSFLAGKANGLLARCMGLFGRELRPLVIPSLILIPDFAFGWIPLTVLKGLHILRKYEIDVIFATSKPNSCAVIGALLSKITGIPLVLDFRDAWRNIIYQLAGANAESIYCRVPDWRDAIDRPIETAVLKQAKQVVFTTREAKNLYQRIYPFLEGRIHTIYNGHMDGLFDTSPPAPLSNFTIVYSGDYYFEQDYSEIFFQALAYLKTDPAMNNKISFVYIGQSEDMNRMFDKYQLHQIASCTGRLDRSKAVENMRRASVLLLRNIKPCLSTKLFEGLAAGLPILALTDEGEATELIRSYAKSYWIVSNGKVGDTISAIRQAIRIWNQKSLSSEPNSKYLQEFSKRSLTEELSILLDQTALTAPKPGMMSRAD